MKNHTEQFEWLDKPDIIIKIKRHTEALWRAQPDVRSLQYVSIIRFITIFLIGVILFRTGISLTEIGSLELILFSVNIASFLWLTGGRRAAESWQKSREDNLVNARPIFITFQIFGGIGSIVSILTLMAFFYKEIVLSELSLFVALYAFFTIASSILDLLLYWQHRYRSVVLYNLLFYVGQLLIIIFFFRQTDDASNVFAILAGLFAIKWLVTVFLTYKSRSNGKSYSYANFMFFAVPLLLEGFFGGIMPYIDGWIVSWHFDKATFTLFQYGAREIPLNIILVAGIVSAFVMKMSPENMRDTSILKKEITRVIYILTPVACLFILLSPWIYSTVYGDEAFRLSARLFSIYNLVFISRILVPHVFIMVRHDAKILGWAAFFEVILNVVLSLILLNWIGILGIPVATVIVYVLHRLYLVLYVKRKYNLSLSDYVDVPKFLLATSAVLLSFVLSQLMV